MDKLPDQNIDTVEDSAMLEQRIAQWEEELVRKGIMLGTERGKVEGREEGKAEGVAEGLPQQKTTLLEMHYDRFTDIPSSWVPIINCLDDPKRINQLTRAIYKVKSSQEFSQMLENSQ